MDNLIDAEIATKIMGWELLTVGYIGLDETPRQTELVEWYEAVGIESVGEYWIDVDTNFWIYANRWRPSLYIAQAWQVLEKFPVSSHFVKILTLGNGQWGCEISTNTIFKPEIWRIEAETAPLAICLACLKTCGTLVER